MTDPSPTTVVESTGDVSVEPGPTTLSGRPVIDAAEAPPRTRVGRGAAFGAGLVVVVAVAAVALALLRGGADGTDVRAMAPGQCYVETDVVDDHGRPIPQGRDTPCLASSPRIVAVIPMPLGSFPSSTDFDAVVAGHCGGEEDFVVLPTEGSWLDGDRTVVCVALPEA